MKFILLNFLLAATLCAVDNTSNKITFNGNGTIQEISGRQVVDELVLNGLNIQITIAEGVKVKRVNINGLQCVLDITQNAIVDEININGQKCILRIPNNHKTTINDSGLNNSITKK